MGTGSSAEFTKTDWDAIRAAAESPEILEWLCRRYRSPVYAYLRARGMSPDRAADLTQDFFSDAVMHKKLFGRADPQRGRLRDLILKAVQNRVIDGYRKDQKAAKDLQGYRDHIVHAETCSDPCMEALQVQAFNDQCVSQYLHEAIERCEAHYTSTGRYAHWHAFELRVIWPAINGTKQPSMVEVAAKTSFPSYREVNSAIDVVRKRLQELIREVIGETVRSDDDWELEVAFVEAALGGSR